MELENIDKLKEMIATGSNINNCDYDSRTAFHLAASEGQYHIIEWLLKIGANKNIRDRWNSLPIDDAIKNKHFNIVRLLRNYDYI